MDATEIPGYGLALPTPGQACRSVLRVAGAEGMDMWLAVCAAAGVPSVAAAYAEEDLLALAGALQGQGGALRVVGHALAVRVHTYRLLRVQAELDLTRSTT